MGGPRRCRGAPGKRGVPNRVALRRAEVAASRSAWRLWRSLADSRRPLGCRLANLHEPGPGLGFGFFQTPQQPEHAARRAEKNAAGRGRGCPGHRAADRVDARQALSMGLMFALLPSEARPCNWGLDARGPLGCIGRRSGQPVEKPGRRLICIPDQ